MERERFDVCIICALAEEAEAFIEVMKQISGVSFTREHSEYQQRDYFSTTIINTDKESLKVLVTWQARMGIIETGSAFTMLLQEFDTRFVAMTGICAGNKKRVQMGDIIVAEKTFIYDAGSFVKDQDGKEAQLPSPITFQTRNDVLQIIRFFKEWESSIELYKEQRPISKLQQKDWILNQLFEKKTTIYALDRKELGIYAPEWKTILGELQAGKQPLVNQERGLSDPVAFQRYIFDLEVFPYQDPAKPECHIGALASGNAVRRDDPFEKIEKVESKILGLDMEGTAIYYGLQNHLSIRSLVVKGVSDYGDGNKDDRYHHYAAMLSAAYVTTFITHFVNNKYMPWPNSTQNPASKPPIVSNNQSIKPPPQAAKPTQTAPTTGTGKPPVKIFISCSESEKDQKLLRDLRSHMALMSQGPQRIIEIWDRNLVESGEDEEFEVTNQLNRAQIILLLITPDYYTSRFYTQEIEQIGLLHQQKVKVIAILLRPTSAQWKKAFFGTTRSLPRNDQAVTLWSDKDSALLSVTEDIRAVVETLQKS